MVAGPVSQKHTTEDLRDALVISMPGRKKPEFIFVLFLGGVVWLLLGCAILLASLITSEFDLTLLTGWVGMGILLIYPLVWQLFGREEIRITNQSIRISDVVFGFRRSKEYLANQISRLRLTRSDYQPQDKINQGLIAFNYDPQGTDQYITFASGIDDIEAKQIIAEIQHKHPQYKVQM